MNNIQRQERIAFLKKEIADLRNQIKEGINLEVFDIVEKRQCVHRMLWDIEKLESEIFREQIPED